MKSKLKSRPAALIGLAALLVTAVISLATAQDSAATEAPDGALIYQNSCAACHMSDGRGAEGAGRYPNLAGNPAVVASPDLVFIRVLNGYGAMPAFRSLSNEQIAAVTNFVRGTLNDAEDVVEAEQVEAFR